MEPFIADGDVVYVNRDPLGIGDVGIFWVDGDMLCKQYYKDNDILLVKAVTAVPMTKEQLVKLTRKLGTITGKQIELRNQVDPDVLGGVRLDYDGKRLDDTVSHRLEAVRAMLKNTVL